MRRPIVPLCGRVHPYDKEGLGWFFRQTTIRFCAEALLKNGGLRLVLSDGFPKRIMRRVQNPKVGVEYEVIVEGRRLGVDTGKDIVYDVADLLGMVSTQIGLRDRTLSSSELRTIARIVSRS